MLRALKIILAVIVAVCLVYVSLYLLSAWRTQSQVDELALQAESLRAATAVPAATSAPDPTPTASPAPVQSPLITSAPTAEPAGADAVGTESAPTAELTEAPAETPTAEPTSTPSPLPTAEPTPEPTPTPEPEDPLLAYYRSLAEQNSDLIGWIRIEGTKINYPVMHTPDSKEYYLHRDFKKSYAFEGLPFLDENCDPWTPSDNLILYGHNMRNGGMFAGLHGYLKEEFFLQHPLINFDTLERRGTYQVFAAMRIRLGDREDPQMLCYSPDMTWTDEDIELLTAYVDKYAAQKNPEALPKKGGEVITLSTCTGMGSSYRLVVMAARVEDAQ